MRFGLIIEEYLRSSTLHGTKFIVDKKSTSWIERIFWLLCLLIAWFASWLLISASLDAFENNPISFVVETSYRDWNTNFPAVIVCESRNRDRIQKIADEFWGSEHDFTLEEILNEIAFFRGELYHTLQECVDVAEPTKNCIHSNYSHFAQLARSSCMDSIKNCFWNEDKFNCCSYFHPMETELGICYAINSIQVKFTKRNLDMHSNRFTGPGSLKIDLFTEANVFILGNEEVPTLVTSKADYISAISFTNYSRSIMKRDIENDEQIRSTSVRQRNCRFPDENNLTVHQNYSHSACLVQCRKDKQIELCNCSSHLTPNTPKWQLCNITGIECLNRNYEDLSVIIAEWSHERRGLICDCLPSCTEVDISTVYDSWENNNISQEITLSNVQVTLSELPTERYKRNLVRGKLDLVVSIGGTGGLFVGVSLLSIVELVYYFFVRPYGGGKQKCVCVIKNQ